MSESDREVLKQLLEICLRIEERINRYDINEERFVEDSALFDMLLMPVFQIGELVGALSESYVNSHKAIPWHSIRGFRNIIGHDYGIVEPVWAWNTIQCDIPVLKEFLVQQLG